VGERGKVGADQGLELESNGIKRRTGITWGGVAIKGGGGNQERIAKQRWRRPLTESQRKGEAIW